jgi:hypothetical protein
MRVNPEYFPWSLEAQEHYRVSMPEHDTFRLRQELVNALFGLHAHTEEDLAKISDQFGDEEHLVFNRALLPTAGVGEDSFFLNEYLDEGKTLARGGREGTTGRGIATEVLGLPVETLRRSPHRV